MNDTINQKGAGASAAWAKTKPTAPGAYWIRGEVEGMLDRTALVEVVNFEGELWCNLHMRNTDPEFGYGYTVAQLDEAFEWLGPLSPAAPVVAAPGLRNTDPWDSARIGDYNAGWNDRHVAGIVPLSDERIFEIAEPFGAFQYGDAQGDKRIKFARAIMSAMLYAPPAHPDAALVEALKDLLPNLDEALEDLELFGLHSDQGYRKLKDWYRKMLRATKAIDTALAGKGGE